MAKAQVLIQAPGGGFNATVELKIDTLGPKLPSRIEGYFLLMEGLHGDRIIHADRQAGGGGPTMWFNCNRDGYHFWMKSKESNEFVAESMG
jgi:hypothetical protein